MFLIGILDVHILTILGNLTLNVAFVLYIIVYIPQIIHNNKLANIANLSLWLHFLLYISYAFDLVYGFATYLPWQYKLVSMIGLTLVMIQHMQLLRLFISKKLWIYVKFNLIFFVVSLAIIYHFLNRIIYNDLSILAGTIFGGIAQICGLIYCIPQIIKNKRLQSTNGINRYFIYLNLTLAGLDTISAWCLNWGWPNKLAAPVLFFLMLIIIGQYKKYTTINLLKLVVNS